jgi:hypothetical protein
MLSSATNGERRQGTWANLPSYPNGWNHEKLCIQQTHQHALSVPISGIIRVWREWIAGVEWGDGSKFTIAVAGVLIDHIVVRHE